MSRHIADHARASGPLRLLHFLRLARAAHPVLVRVSHTPSGPRRVSHFLQIARGRRV
jgi:hypothetical protein